MSFKSKGSGGIYFNHNNDIASTSNYINLVAAQLDGMRLLRNTPMAWRFDLQIDGFVEGATYVNIFGGGTSIDIKGTVNNNNTLDIIVDDTSGNRVTVSTSFLLGEYNNYMMTVDSNWDVVLYKNNVQVDSGTALTSGLGDQQVGDGARIGHYAKGFKGIMSNFQMWDGVVSVADNAILINNPEFVYPVSATSEIKTDDSLTIAGSALKFWMSMLETGGTLIYDHANFLSTNSHGMMYDTTEIFSPSKNRAYGIQKPGYIYDGYTIVDSNPQFNETEIPFVEDSYIDLETALAPTDVFTLHTLVNVDNIYQFRSLVGNGNGTAYLYENGGSKFLDRGFTNPANLIVAASTFTSKNGTPEVIKSVKVIELSNEAASDEAVLARYQLYKAEVETSNVLTTLTAVDLQSYIDTMFVADAPNFPVVTAHDNALIIDFSSAGDLTVPTAELEALYSNMGAMAEESFKIHAKNEYIILYPKDTRSIRFGMYKLLELKFSCKFLSDVYDNIPTNHTKAGYRALVNNLEELFSPSLSYRESWYKESDNTEYAQKLMNNGRAFHRSTSHPFSAQEGGGHYIDNGYMPEDLAGGALISNSQIDWSHEVAAEYFESIISAELTLNYKIVDEIKDADNDYVMYISGADNTSGPTSASAVEAEALYGAASGAMFVNGNLAMTGINNNPYYDGARVSLEAYQAFLKPPTTNIPATDISPNLLISFAPIDNDFGSPMVGQTSGDYLAQWSAIVNGQINVWYYATNFGAYMFPYPNISTAVADIKYMQGLGVEGVFHQGAMEFHSDFSFMKQYIFGQMMWDNTLVLADVMSDFCDGYYGLAGTKMKDAYMVIENAFTLGGEKLPYRAPLDMEYLDAITIDAAYALYDEAEALVSGDDLTRVQHDRIYLDMAIMTNLPRLISQSSAVAAGESLSAPSSGVVGTRLFAWIDARLIEDDGMKFSESTKLDSFYLYLQIANKTMPDAPQYIQDYNAANVGNELVKGVDWFDYSDVGIPFNGFSMESDPLAANGVAVNLDSGSWNLQIRETVLPFTGSDEIWETFITARYGGTPISTDNIINFGILDGPLLNATASELSDTSYTDVFISEWDTTSSSQSVLWASGGGDAVANPSVDTYVDRIFIIKQGSRVDGGHE